MNTDRSIGLSIGAMMLAWLTTCVSAQENIRMANSSVLADFAVSELVGLDLEGDGIEEVIAFDLNGGTYQVFRAGGSGRLEASAAVELGPDPVEQISKADLDGNGLDDLVGLSRDENLVYVLMNHGTGELTPAVKAPLPTVLSATHVQCEDVDRDGFQDIVVAAITSVFVHRNDGQGRFGAPEPLAVSLFPALPTEFVFADLRDSGRLDIAAVRDREVYIFRNDGDGYTLEREISVGGSAIRAWDIDQDGDDDLVIAGDSDQIVTTHSYTGVPPALYETQFIDNPIIFASLEVTDVAFGDINADGRTDIVHAGEESFAPYVFTNLPDDQAFISILETPTTELFQADAVTIANIDQDNAGELVFALQSNQIVVLDTNESGSLRSVGQHIAEQSVPSAVIIPFGAEGDEPRFLITNESTFLPFHTARPVGTGDVISIETTEVSSLRVPASNGRWATGDVNGDSLPDVLGFSSSGYSWSIAQPDGTFTESQFMALDLVGRGLPKVVDVDSDGRKEILALNEAGVVWTISFDAEGVPETPTSFEVSENTNSDTDSLIVQDIDNDGHLDLAITRDNGSSPPGEIVIAYGTAGGGFQHPVAIQTQPGAGSFDDRNGLRCLDLNGDGLNDFLLVARFRLYVQFATGPRQWSEPEAISPDFVAYQIDIADMDADGTDDLVARGRNESLIAYANPAGRFAATERFSSGSSVLADLNDDDKPDVLFVARSGINAVANLSAESQCLADYLPDGELNFFDFAQIIQDVLDQDPAADLNRDGSVNFYDIVVFLDSYNQGCGT